LVLQSVQDNAQRKVVRILESAYQALEGRRLCLCHSPNGEECFPSKGVLVPPSAQTGDFICQMEGDSRYLVLRAAEPVGTFIKEGATFEFVGICNIHSYKMKEVIEGNFVLQ
jgi:hypothetical protein